MAAQDMTKQLLSGATNGKFVKVVATATTGTTIHTAPAGTTGMDYIELWATNNDTVSRNLTLEWGTTTAADGNLSCSIPAASGLTLIVPMFSLGLQNGLLVTAFSDAANKVLINGSVNRVTL